MPKNTHRTLEGRQEKQGRICIGRDRLEAVGRDPTTETTDGRVANGSCQYGPRIVSSRRMKTKDGHDQAPLAKMVDAVAFESLLLLRRDGKPIYYSQQDDSGMIRQRAHQAVQSIIEAHKMLHLQLSTNQDSEICLRADQQEVVLVSKGEYTVVVQRKYPPSNARRDSATRSCENIFENQCSC